MYRLMIVDDEWTIRKGIVARLANLGFHFTQIVEAENGRQALEILEEYRPHIILLDICMPEMDGLALMNKMKPVLPLTKWIIISGYAEFSYAEEALNIGVSGYLLKPFSDKNLTSTFNRVFTEIQEMRELKSNLAKVEVLEKQNTSLAIEQHINQLVHAMDVNAEQMENLYEPNIARKPMAYVLAIFSVDNVSFYESSFHYEDIELIKYALRNIMDELPCQSQKIIVNNIKSINQLIILFYNESGADIIKALAHFLIQVQKKIMELMSISITIGLSDKHSSISPSLYHEAIDAVQNRLIQGAGKMFKYAELKSAFSPNNLQTELDLLKNYMYRKDLSNIETVLRALLTNNRDPQATYLHVNYIWKKINHLMYEVYTSLYPHVLDDFNTVLLDPSTSGRFNDIEEVISYLLTTIIDLLKLENVSNLHSRSKIKIAQLYIEQNFSKELSVNELAFQFGMNTNYFSSAFKKETGVTIVNFISNIRIKNACQLLLETKDSVVDISNQVGIQDSQYFSRVFKKKTGKTPLEYRKERKNNGI